MTKSRVLLMGLFIFTLLAVVQISKVVSFNQTNTQIQAQTPGNSIYINGGTATTYSRNVLLKLYSYPAATKMRIANSLSELSNAQLVLYVSQYSWILTPGDGIKTVYVQYNNGANGALTSPVSDTITLTSIVTPTPALPIVDGQYVYITYTCKNDPTRSSYVSTITSFCRRAYDLLKEANASCYSKSNNVVETYRYSAACARPMLTVTPTPGYGGTVYPTRYPTRTPTPNPQCAGKPNGSPCTGGCVNITCLPGSVCPACPAYLGVCLNGQCVMQPTPHLY